MLRGPSVKGAVKRLSDITVLDLHSLGIRDLKRLLTTLPIVMHQAQGELVRRNGVVIYSGKETSGTL